MLTLAQLATEKERRELRADFYKFCVYMDPEFFTPGKTHLKVTAEAFQAAADGKIKKLAISLPPRAGKSYQTSLFCAWWIGKNPRDGVMRNSYGAELAETFSYYIRALMTDEKYLYVFPDLKLRKDKQSIDDWALETAKQTTYFCAGVGGAITGKGARLLVLDDPIKGVEEAFSELVMEKTWNWYGGNHMARKEKDHINIHIATRWSKKDPIGRLTDPESPFYDKDFVVIKISALDENGQSYCEEIMSTEEYIEQKRITDPAIWEAEFMQNPIEEKGLLFPIGELNRFSINELNGVPDGTVGFTDTADEGTDFLCSAIGKRYGDKTYITDVLFTQEGVEITEPLTARLIIDTECNTMKIEANNGGSGFSKNVQRILKEEADKLKEIGTPDSMQKAAKILGYYTYFEQTSSNKETRILMNSGYIKQYFYFRNDYAPGSDYDKFMRQFTSYVKMGKNKHDDAPDAVTGLAEYMQNNFYIPKVKDKIPVKDLGPNWDYTELEDKGYSKYEIQQYIKMYRKGTSFKF